MYTSLFLVHTYIYEKHCKCIKKTPYTYENGTGFWIAKPFFLLILARTVQAKSSPMPNLPMLKFLLLRI